MECRELLRFASDHLSVTQTFDVETLRGIVFDAMRDIHRADYPDVPGYLDPDDYCAACATALWEAGGKAIQAAGASLEPDVDALLEDCFSQFKDLLATEAYYRTPYSLDAREEEVAHRVIYGPSAKELMGELKYAMVDVRRALARRPMRMRGRSRGARCGAGRVAGGRRSRATARAPDDSGPLPSPPPDRGRLDHHLHDVDDLLLAGGRGR